MDEEGGGRWKGKEGEIWGGEGGWRDEEREDKGGKEGWKEEGWWREEERGWREMSECGGRVKGGGK